MAGQGFTVRLSAIPNVTKPGVLETPLLLPALLGDFEVSEEAVHTEYDTISAGQFSVPAGGDATARQLRSLGDAETLSIEYDPPWLVTQGVDPEDLRRDLFAILRARTPFDLLVTEALGQGSSELHMDATLRTVSRVMRHGQTGIRYYSLGIKEWRDASLRRRSAEPGRARGVRLPAKHRLTAGDSAQSLSKHYYGSASGARFLMESIGLRSWGLSTPLVETRRFKVGDSITIPQPPLVGVAGPSVGSLGG